MPRKKARKVKVVWRPLGKERAWGQATMHPRRPLIEVDPRLSPARELEVLELMAESLNNQQIARRLFLSAETVKTHVQRISEKLQTRDRLQAVVHGIRLGLVDWPDPG